MIKRRNEYGEYATQREVRSIRARLGRLARDDCAIYSDGCPFPVCIVEVRADRVAANPCPYFLRHILPGSPALENEFHMALPEGHPAKPSDNAVPGKRCATCKTSFQPKSNRQKYCPECAAASRRKSDRLRKRQKGG